MRWHRGLRGPARLWQLSWELSYWGPHARCVARFVARRAIRVAARICIASHGGVGIAACATLRAGDGYHRSYCWSSRPRCQLWHGLRGNGRRRRPGRRAGADRGRTSGRRGRGDDGQQLATRARKNTSAQDAQLGQRTQISISISIWITGVSISVWISSLIGARGSCNDERTASSPPPTCLHGAQSKPWGRGREA